jgi:hypothetical protein
MRRLIHQNRFAALPKRVYRGSHPASCASFR